tara:strand:+ start:617 stop:1039 length:423 start_codon:yes stop_codon:yes gene_type:complete
MWNKGDWVVIVNGTFEKSKGLKDVSFSIAQILEEGLDDLLVQPQIKASWGSKRAVFVPKSRCKYIPIDIPDVYEEKRRPHLGDLVYYYHRDYNGQINTSVSHVWELRSELSEEPSALITVDTKQRWVSVRELLVLDTKDS